MLKRPRSSPCNCASLSLAISRDRCVACEAQPLIGLRPPCLPQGNCQRRGRDPVLRSRGQHERDHDARQPAVRRRLPRPPLLLLLRPTALLYLQAFRRPARRLTAPAPLSPYHAPAARPTTRTASPLPALSTRRLRPRTSPTSCAQSPPPAVAAAPEPGHLKARRLTTTPAPPFPKPIPSSLPRPSRAANEEDGIAAARAENPRAATRTLADLLCAEARPCGVSCCCGAGASSRSSVGPPSDDPGSSLPETAPPPPLPVPRRPSGEFNAEDGIPAATGFRDLREG